MEAENASCQVDLVPLLSPHASGERRAEDDIEELRDGSWPKRPNSELARGR
jgi:hypothetical protein